MVSTNINIYVWKMRLNLRKKEDSTLSIIWKLYLEVYFINFENISKK